MYICIAQMNGTKKNGTGETLSGEELMRLVKAYFAAQGSTYTAWAKSHNYSPQIVSYAILHRGTRGVLVPRIRGELYRELGLPSNNEEFSRVAP